MFKIFKSPSAHSGRYAPIVSLLLLVCAVVLLLLLSGRDKDTQPSGAQPDDSAQTSTETDADVTEEQEPPAPVLTWDELEPVIQRDLRVLSDKVLGLSQDLAALEAQNPENLQLADILSDTANWLNILTAQVTNLRNECNMYHGDADTRAPGLTEFSQRLATMSRVVRRNQPDPPEKDLGLDEFKTAQEALAKFRTWAEELTKRAKALPDVPHAASGTPSDASAGTDNGTEPQDENDALAAMNEKLDAMSKHFDEQFQKVLKTADEISKTADEISGTADEISKNVADIPKASPDVVIWIAVAFSVLGCLLVLSLHIWPPVTTRRAAPVQNPAGQDPQLYDMLKKLSAKVDALSERVNGMSQNDALADIQSDLISVTQMLQKQQAPSFAKPEIQYFQVTGATVADGQPVYLRKLSGHGEIYGTPADANSEKYFVFPKGTEKDRTSGTVPQNVLYTGSIKQCFHMPKQRPVAANIYVTVKKPAVIQWNGSQYQLISPGELSVTGGA